MIIEAMKQAIEVLEMCEVPWPNTKYIDVSDTIKLLLQTIEEVENKKPVAWLRNDSFKVMTDVEKQGWLLAGEDNDYWGDLVREYTIPLYK